MSCHGFHDLRVLSVWYPCSPYISINFIIVLLEVVDFSMQNNSNVLYRDNKKVINLKSEVLFREAEDDFFYFNKVNSAFKKLALAVELTPFHTKSLMLLADICFIKGDAKRALKYYQQAEVVSADKSKIYASFSNCYYVLKDYASAIKYVDLSLSSLKSDEFSLYSQLVEIKINALVELKRYSEANDLFEKSKQYMDSLTFKSIYNSSFEVINEKLKLKKRQQQVKLRIV